MRYQILGRGDDETRRFAIDPITGQVRAIASFARDAGKVFGFDVKATDRRGADDGASSIANVFVSKKTFKIHNNSTYPKITSKLYFRFMSWTKKSN